MILFNKFLHLPVEERKQQGADVRAVDVGIGHDDDAVVAKLCQVVLFAPDTATERGDERPHLRRRQHPVEPGPLDIQNLSLEWKNRLKAPVATLLRRPSGRVSLHHEQLREARILLLAVGELAGKAGDIQCGLPSGHFPGLAGGFARARRLDDLSRNRARLARGFEQEFGQLLAHRRLDRGLDLGGDELVLGLRRELRVRHLDRQHGGEAFAHIVPRRLDPRLLRQPIGVHVLIQRPGQGRAESRKMRSAVTLGNIVREAEDVLLV